jgi:type IV secretory pathway component VirB8
MTPEQLSDKKSEYWRDAARYASEKYMRTARIMRRFIWATAILGALLGIAVVTIVIMASAQ